MDERTLLAWVQLAAGALVIISGYVNWRDGRATGRDGLISGAMMLGLGLAILTAGWVRHTAQAFSGLGFAWIAGRMFALRDRFGLWAALLFGTFTLVIAVTELRFDTLSSLEQALMLALALVGAALIVTMTVRIFQPTVKPDART